MDEENTKKYKKAYKGMKGARNILLIAHKRPDGDALASMCGLSLLLDKMDKKYTLFCPDPPGEIFYFLPNIDRVESNIIKIKENFSQYDLIIILDCGTVYRTDLVEEITGHTDNQYIIEFDHHPSEEHISDLEIRLPEKSSTAEVLYHFFKINFLFINKEIAECILTGILTDTANFLYPRTTHKSLEIASTMLAKGANYPKITKHTWQNKSVTSMRLWSLVLNNLHINKKYNIAFTVLTGEEMKYFKNEEDAMDSILHMINNINGVKAIIFLKQEDGIIKGNLRTNHSKINVCHLANHLGGGGHSKASGFAIEGEIRRGNNSWRVL